VYVVDPPEEKSGCSIGTVIIGLLVGLGIFALLVFIFYPYAEQPPQSNTVNVNLSIDATNKQTTEIIITTPEPREPPTPRPTEPPPTPRPTPEKPTPAPKPTAPTKSNGNTR
jgi:outer membrane biosynthesis protein TonB